MKTNNIILFGGSFDPVHAGHVQVAKSALSQCAAEALWFLPAGLPWQKGSTTAHAQHRLGMLTAALPLIPHARVETYELEQSGRSYTVATLIHLSSQYREVSWLWIMGSDQLERLPSWYAWQSLPELARIGVIARPGCIQSPTAETQQWFDEGRMFWIPMPPSDESSSKLRQALSNPSQRELALRRLPTKVADYIEVHHLYPPKPSK